MKNKNIVWIILIIIIIAAVGWFIYTRTDQEGEVSGSIDTIKTLDVRLGEGKSVQGVNIVPLEVLEDSRCAQGVQCIQAGTVRLRTKISIDDEKFDDTSEFTLFVPKIVAGSVVTLVAVSPEPEASKQISPNVYTFRFAVNK